MVGFFFSSQHVAPPLLSPPNTPNRHDQLLKHNLTSILRSNSSDSNPEDFFFTIFHGTSFVEEENFTGYESHTY